MVSEIDPDGLAASSRAVFIGDAVLSVNGHNLRKASCQEALAVLTNIPGNVTLELQHIAIGEHDDDNYLAEVRREYRNASNLYASVSLRDLSPKLQLGESLQQKDASLSSGNDNTADHNQLDNIEGQKSVKLQQTVNEPSICPNLKKKEKT